ncbi:MAG: hypothetical protein GX364_01350 [Firmicutes bacterium]|nr:hypothetical protein [Bacillota bacterium]
MKEHETMTRLTVHARIKTRTKLFCSCSASSEAAPPNSRCCPVCLGLPGSLPVLNGRALELAVVTALTLNCSPAGHLCFDRKHYANPLLPRGYLICQHFSPLGSNGYLKMKSFRGKGMARIARVELEEAPAETVHERMPGSGCAGGIDFNRAGVAMIKIVSDPDLFTPGEAQLYLEEIRLLLTYIGVSGSIGEKGSLFYDIDIFSKPDIGGRQGEVLKIKNITSIDHVGKALAYELQHRACDRGGTEGEGIVETYSWDEAAGKTRLLERAAAHPNYFSIPDPDLPPIHLEKEWIKKMKKMIPELPETCRERFHVKYLLDEDEIEILIADPRLRIYFEGEVRQGKDPRKLSRRICRNVLRAILHEDRKKASRQGFSGLTETPMGLNRERINRTVVRKILAEAENGGTNTANPVDPPQQESTEKK